MTQPNPELDPSSAATVGRIIAPHGIKGEVKVEPLTDFPKRFQPGTRLWLNGRQVRIRASRPVGKLIYLTLDGVTDRSRADRLRDALLQVKEVERLPAPDVFYQHDIVGLPVETEAGEVLGRVESIFPTGSNDVYVVRGERGELLLPAVEDVIKQVDIKAGRVVVEVLPGLEFTPGRSTGPPRTRRPQRQKAVKARAKAVPAPETDEAANEDEERIESE